MWDIIIAIVSIFLAIYLWCTWNNDYWQKHNVPFIKPTFIFGSIKDLILMRKHIGDVYAEFYWKYPKEPAVGIYRLLSPQLVLRDLDLIKTAYIKEFSSFHDNEMEINEGIERLLYLNPFIAKGDKWKTLRTFHSHALSSAKLKGMFTLMLEVCKDMSEFLKQNEGKPLETKYFSGQYTTDVVASCVYGLKTNSFIDPKAEFRQISAKIFERDWYFNLTFMMFNLVPSLAKILRMRFLSKDVENFFFKVIGDLCEYRTTNNVSRPDFIQTMLDENLQSDKPKYTIQEISAHSMTFFIDGYETSSILMSFTIYLLAVYPEYQERLRKEIDEIKQITYEEVHKLKYLDAFINETLRMYPPALITTRVCTKDTTLQSADRNYPMRKGMTIALPLYALHNDPAYFPEPEQFNPDRFYDTKAPTAFAPFGMGPRACLGSRFALTQVKTGLTYLVKNFKIFPKESDAKLPIIDEKTSILISPPASGLWVKFEKI